MAKPALLVLDPGHPGQNDALAQDFHLVRLWKETDPDSVIRHEAESIRGIVTYLTPVRDRLINALPNLEMVAAGSAGLDHIDLDACNTKGISVSHIKGILSDDVADLTMGLVISLMRRIVEGDAFIRAGMWQKGGFPLSVRMAGKKLGLVGMGRIGRAIARRAGAFDMDILYTARGPKEDLDYPYVADVKTLAAESDCLVLACEGGPETQNMIDFDVLKALGPKGYLVNIARGSVVKEDDLLAALQNKDIAGAALDVFAKEPAVPDAFFRMDNVVLTPHIGSATQETRREMGEALVRDVLAYFSGGKPYGRVDSA